VYDKDISINATWHESENRKYPDVEKKLVAYIFSLVMKNMNVRRVSNMRYADDPTIIAQRLDKMLRIMLNKINNKLMII
jgi:hypothetical protein